MKYFYYNANPKNNFIEDCVIRSLSVAQRKPWVEVYEELSAKAKEKGMLFSNVSFVEEYLDSLYKRKCVENKTVGEFAKEHPYNVYLVSMPSHITCIFYGIVIDTFDCTNRKMWCAWEVD